MKKVVTALVLLSLALNGHAEVTENSDKINTEDLKSPLIGALTGGVIAGPPGVMAGLIGGVLFGQIKQQNNQILHASRELVHANEQVELLSAQQAGQHARLLQQLQANRTRLHAIADGFSFCLRFRTESAAVEPALQPHLDALAGMLNAFKELNIQVRASADVRGSVDYNRQLTKLRAEAVAQHLINAGVATQRIVVRDNGEGAAIYPENDPERLGFDRYVVLTFLPEDAS